MQTIELVFFSPTWKLPALSVPPASALSSSLLPRAALAPLSLFLLHWGAQHCTQHSRHVSPLLKGKDHLPGLLAMLLQCSSGCCWLHVPWRQHCRAAFQLVSPRCVPIPGVIPSQMQTEICVFPCWTSWDCSLLSTSACQGLFGWWHNQLVYQALLPVSYRLWSSWGCSLFHCLGH